MSEKNLFDSIELHKPENTDVGVKDVVTEDIPSVTSIEWNDYVLSLFEENEMIEGITQAIAKNNKKTRF